MLDMTLLVTNDRLDPSDFAYDIIDLFRRETKKTLDGMKK
jgi:hypothetical protein